MVKKPALGHINACVSFLYDKANMNTHDHQYQDIRDAIRDLCKQFPDEYFRKVDEARGYP